MIISPLHNIHFITLHLHVFPIHLMYMHKQSNTMADTKYYFVPIIIKSAAPSTCRMNVE